MLKCKFSFIYSIIV